MYMDILSIISQGVNTYHTKTNELIKDCILICRNRIPYFRDSLSLMDPLGQQDQ